MQNNSASRFQRIDVHDFRASGYLPDVLLNYIALLGWSPGDNVERFDVEFLAQRFDVGRIGKSNARFDRDKLLAFNTDTLAATTPDAFEHEAAEHDRLFHAGAYRDTLGLENFARFCEAYRERSRTLDEPFENGAFFIAVDDQVAYDDKAVKKVLQKGDGAGYAVLRDLLPKLRDLPEWTPQDIEHVLTAYAQQRSLGMGKVAQPLRVALTGGTVSPPIYDTLAILGKDSTLTRIQRCIAAASAPVTGTSGQSS